MSLIVTMTIEFEERADYDQFREVIDQNTYYVSFVEDSIQEDEE